MGKLIYLTPTSLDGYIGDGNYDWSAPDEEGLAFLNGVMRGIRLFLYGRKTYETMAVWETPEAIPGRTQSMMDFAPIWQAADKIVYSHSLRKVATSKTRLEHGFDPQAIRELKARLPHDISVGGPNLAAQAIRSGLVDEYHLFVVPVILGGGIRILPSGVNVKLDLLDQRRFSGGWVYLRYQTRA